MVVDYSKWDKLELSDDSDVEVHPNVDKQSFIRWKQRDIHDKREQLKENIRQLELSVEMNTDLLARIDQLVSVGEKGDEKLSESIPKSVQIAARGFTKTGPDYEVRESDNVPSYNDMIENLLEQVKDEVKGESEVEEKTVEKLKEHRKKLTGVLDGQKEQLVELREERSRHIVSEDLHTGFDSTFITKKKEEEVGASKGSGKAEKASESSIEVLNPGASGASGSRGESAVATTSTASDDDDVKASPAAIKFAEIPIGEYSRAYSYLQSHRGIINEHEKDGLMMEAFQQQLDGKAKDMERTVHNALLLQYCYTLGPDGLQRFFSKVTDKTHQANKAFLEDVKFTVNHIRERCRVLASEREGEPEEQIQLHAVDPDTEIVVHVPDPDASPDALAVYNSLSPELRTAVESGKLDEINKILANLSVEEAEDVIKKFDESGVLSVEEKIYDATQWQREHNMVGEDIDARQIVEEAKQHEQESGAQTQTPTVDDVD